MEDLYIMGWKGTGPRSEIWKSFGKIWPIVKENIKWHFGNGQKMLIGCSNELITGPQQHINEGLILNLNQRGFFYIHQIIERWDSEAPRCKSFLDSSLDEGWEVEWNVFIIYMRSL